MSVYFVASIRIEDPEEYELYLSGTDEVFARYNGEYLAVDAAPRVLEGSFDYSRSVIIRFPSEKDFDAWYHSEEYRKILAHRLKAARCDTILVKGFR